MVCSAYQQVLLLQNASCRRRVVLLKHNMTKFVYSLFRAFSTAVLLVSIAPWALRLEANAQSTKSSALPRSASNAKVILDVTATDFQIGPQTDYLYLRVFSDRSAEAQTLTRRTVIDKAVVADLKTRLTQNAFTEILHLTEDPEILKLDALYRQRIGIVLDVFTSWKIKIRRTDSEQKVEVIAFAPEEARLRHRPYPEPLVKLGCTIEKIRSETIGESAELDNECRRVLWMHAPSPR